MNHGDHGSDQRQIFPPHHMSNYKKLSISDHFMLHAQGGQTLVPIRIVAFNTRFPSVQLLMQAAETREIRQKVFVTVGQPLPHK